MRFWCPTELEIPSGVLKFDLPTTEKEFNYANSVGLCYEADEVRRCIQAGLTESEGMSLDETLVVAEIMEEIRKQLGVVYPQDE
jgi:dihydrodiol dehydrogenase / D-xylose 1-dehydrogenase (NADP)